MNYKVRFEIFYLNGSSRFSDTKIETKGKGKKVLRAHIKDYIKNTFVYERESHPVDIRIVRIERVDELNINNVWNKDDRKLFIDKCYHLTN